MGTFYMINQLTFPMITDGGLSNVLEHYGCDLNNPLWSATLLQSDPEKIIQAHSNDAPSPKKNKKTSQKM